MLGDKHGLSKHPLHSIWHGIKCRCYGKTSKGYDKYGAVGVIMCDEWRNNFKSFYDWAISNGWEKGLQIDKDIKANNLGVKPNLYSPERCTIVTAKVNSNNRVTNRLLSLNGETKTISEWADFTGIPRNAIRMRIESHGFTVEQALTTPLGKKRPQFYSEGLIKHNGIELDLSDWAKILNARRSIMIRSLKRGKTFEQIFDFYKRNK